MKLYLMNDFIKFLKSIPQEYHNMKLIFSEDWDGEDLYPYSCQISGGEDLHSMGEPEGILLINTDKEARISGSGNVDVIYSSLTLENAIKWWSYLTKECWLNRFIFYTETPNRPLGHNHEIINYYIPKFQWNIGPDGVYVNLYRTTIDEQKLEWQDTLKKYNIKG